MDEIFEHHIEGSIKTLDFQSRGIIMVGSLYVESLRNLIHKVKYGESDFELKMTDYKGDVFSFYGL